jgi:hypothetical protein
MIIREQGRQVQLIRSPYNKDLKRCIPHVFMNFPKRERYESAYLDDYLTQEQKEELTEQEKDKLQTWFIKKEIARKSATSENALASVESVLREAAKGAKNDYSFLNNGKALAIYEAIDELQKQLRKKGYTRPAPAKAEPEPPPVVEPVAAAPAKKAAAKKTTSTATKGAKK